MYQIDLSELLESNIDGYKNFNEFFYRKLKPDVRPIAERHNPNIIVSAADCRLIVFDNISDATEIWIKGHNFSLKHLFDDDYMAQKFAGGSLAIFRLAPVDYHRFHAPVGGHIGEFMKQITGTYYTVNPIAIKENLDVLTRNQRTFIAIENEDLGCVAFVAIGALLVGSVNFTVEPRQPIDKGDELGYFAYGGSTIVAVFEPGIVTWDNDLKHNSDNSMETLVRMGEQIGQKSTDEQRAIQLTNAKRGKNATITHLLTSFPLARSVK